MAKITAKAKLVENVRSVVDNSRDHSVVCDLPTSKGGDNSGPTALELAIMALSDCAATIFANIAKNSEVELDDLEVVSEAEKPSDSPKLNGVKMEVRVSAEAREKLLEALGRKTEKSCPVAEIFRKPIPVEFELKTKTEE